MSEEFEGAVISRPDPVGGPTVVIVIGAEALHPDAVASVPDGAVVMAADSGLDHARAAGLTPTVLVGDLDSVSAEGLAWAEGNSSIERHPVDKDATDTELALRHAVDLGDRWALSGQHRIGIAASRKQESKSAEEKETTHNNRNT